jgi:hypothetical protein
MLQIIKKLRRFRARYISSKTVAIWALNKKLPAEWGSISDLQLERENNTLTIYFHKDRAETNIEIQGYKLDNFQNDTCLSWEKIIVNGSRKYWYLKQFNQRNKIVIPPIYVALVEKLDRNRQLTASAI